MSEIMCECGHPADEHLSGNTHELYGCIIGKCLCEKCEKDVLISWKIAKLEAENKKLKEAVIRRQRIIHHAKLWNDCKEPFMENCQECRLALKAVFDD